ncbi:MAG: ABC transporter ATP-binding protein [Eubacterium sp.]|nr:ABC transporter ATP-binding protein [Eubacterium sp.]
MIEVKNLVKRYSGRNVVDNLSFTVEKGQIVGFLGPNGAGKSTTMNIITGYISATEGTVTVNGYDVVEEPEKAKACIGYLPEQPPLYPDMLVSEYLGFVCDLKKVKKADKDAVLSRVMHLARITDVSGRLIKHLSKGYKQRVGLAGAMIGDPEVLILDEPTVGLDPKQILEMRDLIRELSKKHTILLSSHIMQEVSAVCNQIMIINNGRLVVADRPEEIPKHIEQKNEITMLIKGNKELIKSILEPVEYVERISVSDTAKNEIYQVELASPVEYDVRENVFYALADARCAILEMNSKVPTLEEAFIRLTGSARGMDKKGGTR